MTAPSRPTTSHPTTVHQGEYVGIQTFKGGTVRCNSGSSNIALFTPPCRPGGSYRTPTDYSGCSMLIQVVYQ